MDAADNVPYTYTRFEISSILGATMRRRNIALAVMALLIVGALVASLNWRQRSATLAEPGETAYSISDVSIDYPLLTRTNEAIALVRFSSRWPTEEFPGYATCRASLLDSTGAAMAHQEFQYATFVAQGSVSSAIEVETDAEPTSAEVRCSEGEKPSRTAGYELSDLQVQEQEKAPPHLVFHVKWLTDKPPLYQSCVADFSMADGTSSAYRFGLSVGTNQEATVLLNDHLADARPRGIVCAPFTG